MNAAVIAAAVSSQRNAKEARKRRMDQRINDELLIHTKLSKETVGKRLASVFCNWYYEDGYIWVKKAKINLWAVIYAFIGLLFAVHFLWAYLKGYWVMDTYMFFIKTDFGIISSLVIMVLSLFVGFIFGGDTFIDYIQLKENKILFLIYDDEGYRNIHEDELDDLLKVIE